MLPLAVPVELSREAARRAASLELAKREYSDARPGLVERFVTWVFDAISNLADGAASVSPGGYAGLVLALVVVVAAVVAVRAKVGPLARSGRTESALFLGRPRSAAEHRTAAEAHARSGDWAEAVRERLRAVVRSLEERSLLEPRPGRTADEAASEAGLLLPGCADGLREAASLFDDIWYGGRPATEAAYAALRGLDERALAERPVLPVSR
jgi:uncharacterized protein DUF4129